MCFGCPAKCPWFFGDPYPSSDSPGVFLANPSTAVCVCGWLSYLHYFQERRPFLWELLKIWCARGPPYALSSGTYTFITFVPSWSHPIAESFLSPNERKLHLLQWKVPLSEEFALMGWVLLFLAKRYAALTNCAHVVKMDQNNFLWNR